MAIKKELVGRQPNFCFHFSFCFVSLHDYCYCSNYVCIFYFAFCAKLSLWDVANACLLGSVQKQKLLRPVFEFFIFYWNVIIC